MLHASRNFKALKLLIRQAFLVRQVGSVSLRSLDSAWSDGYPGGFWPGLRDLTRFLTLSPIAVYLSVQSADANEGREWILA